MESSAASSPEYMYKSALSRYMALVSTSMQSGTARTLLYGNQPAEAWLFRDDIGAPHGIKGYEEQVNSVGM
jgi:hypothetical protein